MSRRRAHPLTATNGAHPFHRVCEAAGCRLQGEYRAPYAMGVLELSWPLTQADVKSRYKELVKIHHPDANGGARDAEEKLKEINAAYSTLRASEHLPAQ